jgi:hypothetical protein
MIQNETHLGSCKSVELYIMEISWQYLDWPDREAAAQKGA